jgi:hypothetical protein
MLGEGGDDVLTLGALGDKVEERWRLPARWKKEVAGVGEEGVAGC